jgi:hypothetical protein
MPVLETSGNFSPDRGSQDHGDTPRKEDKEMKRLSQFGILLAVMIIPGWAMAGEEKDPRDLLRTQDIASVRINLNPFGPHLGFEVEIEGGDTRLDALIAVIREAEPGGGHKCPNRGAIRFRLADGAVIGVGLLPSHIEETYGLRLYHGERFVKTYQVRRASLLAALHELEVPSDDPAFRE